MISTNEILSMSAGDLLRLADREVREDLGSFIREFNRREWYVRIGGETYKSYMASHHTHRQSFGHGFVAGGEPVPYFHPNRSFHDEVIWLNKNLYYDPSVTFTNKLLNSALVKFYGPSSTLDIITGRSRVKGSVMTELPYVDFQRYSCDTDYAYTVLKNIELAKAEKRQLWGTTELRTSLQTASSKYSSKNPSQIDVRGIPGLIEPGLDSRNNKMRSSDMIHWVASMREHLLPFYESKPTMKESFETLTGYSGIGNYYGYHFSSNLCRMPGVGASDLIETPATIDSWKRLSSVIDVNHGNLNENADYVVAGPGACSTLSRLWPEAAINTKTTMKMIMAIRDDQFNFFGINDSESIKQMRESTELGQYTTFGVEIACCQYSVFDRLRGSLPMAINRARAPISKEVSGDSNGTLENFF